MDKAIEYMIGQNISSMSIASALLGGSLGLLTRSLSDEAVVQILTNAIGSVRAGEFPRSGTTGQRGPDPLTLPPPPPGCHEGPNRLHAPNGQAPCRKP